MDNIDDDISKGGRKDRVVNGILLKLYAEAGDFGNFEKITEKTHSGKLFVDALPYAVIGGNLQILDLAIHKAYTYLFTGSYIKLLDQLVFLSIEYDKAEMFKFLVEVYEANANWNSIMNLVVRLSNFIKTLKVENAEIVSQVNKLADAYGVL